MSDETRVRSEVHTQVIRLQKIAMSIDSGDSDTSLESISLCMENIKYIAESVFAAIRDREG